MATIRSNGNWIQFDSHNNQRFEDDDEESLSLCDLPTNNTQTDANSKKEFNENESEDFQFGSFHGNVTFRSPENMCNADDIFFQGRILPLVSSDISRKINRSASMSVINCRSNRNDPTTNGDGYKPKIRNLFHSHPSPSPQIRTQSFRTISHSNSKTSSLWSFLQVGLVKPQEIGLADLKNRSKRFGSHNSNSSSNSSINSSSNDQNQNKNKCHGNGNGKNTNKKKPRLFFGGCKCSAVTTDGTIKETVGKKKTTKEESMLHLRNLQVSEESTMIGIGKQTASRHRTFEWLKQLSIAAAASEAG